jgi:hypothetical protein
MFVKSATFLQKMMVAAPVRTMSTGSIHSRFEEAYQTRAQQMSSKGNQT